MRRLELIALRSNTMSWDRLCELLPSTLEALGLNHDPAGTDGRIKVADQGDHGRLLTFDDSALARRAALALATRSGGPVGLFEVIATSGGKQFRFRTAAWKAMADGALLPAEGKELDLEDTEQHWGGGSLEEQADRVLEEFAHLDDGVTTRTLEMGYRRRPGGRPSSPRVGTLLASLQKARSHQAQPQADGRVALTIDLAAGGKQTSFCSAAEHEELQRLLVGKR